jgi:ankyrin repeat protein
MSSGGESVIKPRPGDPNRKFVLPSRISQLNGTPHLESLAREEKLFQAVYAGDLDQVKLLLYQKVDHGVRHTGLAMSTPLHLAIIAKQTKCAEYLIDRGACPYVLNSLGKSPMDYAMENKEMMRSVILAIQIREQSIRRLRERPNVVRDRSSKNKAKARKDQEEGADGKTEENEEHVKEDAEDDPEEEKAVEESSGHDSPMVVEEEESAQNLNSNDISLA